MSINIPSEFKTLNHDKKKDEVEEPADVQELLKYEFQKLSKEFRKLEKNRHGFAHKEGGVRIRSNFLIPLLEKDRKELRYELRNATSSPHKKLAESLTNEMKRTLQTYELYREEISRTIKQIEEIERHVDKTTEKVNKQQIKMMAIHGLSISLPHRERNLVRAEDKLYHITCLLNLQLHENKLMRDEISDLLIERSYFFKDRKSVKRQVTKIRKKMLRVVQLAFHTYDSRDDAFAKLKSLREKEEKESRQFGLELQELKRSFHHYNEVLSFIRIKLRKREVYEQAKERRLRVMSQREKELDSILVQYHSSFRKILAYSPKKSLSDLVERFIKLDLKNFEAFKYSTNLNNECEVLREAIEILKSQIEDAHGEIEARKTEQRETQEKVHLKIIRHQEHVIQLDSVSERNARKISRAVDILNKAMVESECDQGSLFVFLGNKSKELQPQNIGLALALLDIKITEMKNILAQFSSAKKSINEAEDNEFKNFRKSKTQLSQGGPYSPKLYMFSVDTIDDEEDKVIEEEPFYYKEMRDFVFQKMVEDGVISPSARTISKSFVVNLDLETQHERAKSTSAHRKSLTEKMLASDKKLRHSGYMQSEQLLAAKSGRNSLNKALSITSEDDVESFVANIDAPPDMRLIDHEKHLQEMYEEEEEEEAAAAEEEEEEEEEAAAEE